MTECVHESKNYHIIIKLISTVDFLSHDFMGIFSMLNLEITFILSIFSLEADKIKHVTLAEF